MVAEFVGVQPADRIRELLAPYLAPVDSAGSPDLAVRVAAAQALLAGNHSQAMRLLLAHMASHGRFARAVAWRCCLTDAQAAAAAARSRSASR